MKSTRDWPPHPTVQTALRSAFPIDARRLTVFAALVLAMIQTRTVVLYSLKNAVALEGTREVRYQRLLRFMQFSLPDELFARFALSFLPEGPLDLILDRTNWKLGQRDVNILLLSAVWNGFSLPLMWTVLAHGGNSNQRTREALVERFLGACPHRPVRSLLADREFIGAHWFGFLDEHGIAPCIRLPARATLGRHRFPVWAMFRKLQPGEVRVSHRRYLVYGVSLRVAATKNAAGETLYLAYRGHVGPNLRRYAQRWQAENLHSALKTRGFNLEDTGLTHPERISTLLVVVATAFIWACVTGELLEARYGVTIKRHGHRAVSVFRRGLDHLQDLLLRPSRRAWRELASLVPRFEG